MRLPLTTLLILLVAAAPAAAKRPFCDTRAGATVVSDGSHRVYERIIPSKSDPDADVTSVYVCANGSRKPSHRLVRYHNNLDGEVRIQSGQIAGRWLLVVSEEETGTDDGFAASVYDLKKSRPTGGGVFIDGSDPFRDTAITDDGAFAVLTFDGTLGAYDNAGAHALASGAVALGSGGAFVYWRNADRTTGSAELAGPPTKFAEVD